MRRLLLCVACVAAVLAVGSADAPAEKAARPASPSLSPGSPYLLEAIARHRRETWHWQRLMGKTRTLASFDEDESRDPAYRRWVLELWKQRASRARRAAQHPPRLRQWLCIYRHERHPEQGWGTATGNGFYGGLQMNIAFQRRHAQWLLRRKGTANRWSPVEQIWIAERGRKVQGWGAWPNTARACGLL